MTNMSREPLMDGGVGAIDGGASESIVTSTEGLLIVVVDAADSATRRAKAATPVGGVSICFWAGRIS